MNMNPPVRRIAPILALTVLFAVSAFAAGAFDPGQFTRGNFQGCEPTGLGGDPYLSSLKNRDKPPTGMIAVYTVDSLYKATPALPKKKVPRSKWTPAQRALAATWECKAVMVEISPRGWMCHPNWKNATAYLKPVVDAKEKVRVTGWLTYDQEHPEQLGKT